MIRFVTQLVILACCNTLSFSNDNFLYHHQVSAKPGDGPIRFLARYQLDGQKSNQLEFYRLNNLSETDPLINGKKYFLPVHIYRYDGKSIRSTIGDSDYDKALQIQRYNEWLYTTGRRRTSYLISKILWVPFHLLAKHRTIRHEQEVFHMPVLGEKHSKVHKRSDLLKGNIYYLISGHGGPDPGAIGKRNGHHLCEDEYAYDVVLRLYRGLWEQGAEAYLIVQDQADGIRDEQILMCDKDERVAGEKLPLNQLKRLQQRVRHVNDLYIKHRKSGAKQQTCISVHIDSRGVNHRQDVFFYHTPGSKSSKKLAESMKSTFQKKYKKHRSGGHYSGTVVGRRLFVLRNTYPTAVYVELANIQNQSDHRRILQASNRQALANWMLEGILRAAK